MELEAYALVGLPHLGDRGRHVWVELVALLQGHELLGLAAFVSGHAPGHGAADVSEADLGHLLHDALDGHASLRGRLTHQLVNRPGESMSDEEREIEGQQRFGAPAAFTGNFGRLLLMHPDA